MELESVSLGIDRSFSSDVKLVLYEDGRLTRARRFRETCTRGFGWEQEEEEDLDYAAAVSIYGLDAIASGLAGALKGLPAVRTVPGSGKAAFGDDEDPGGSAAHAV